MRRKRRSGASGDEIAEVLVSCGFPRVRGIWFTVAFRETITIAAIGCPGRCVTPPLARSKRMGPGSAEHHKSAAPRPGHDAVACRAMRRRWSDQQCLGIWAIRERHASTAAAQENEGVGEHVRTRFHLDLKTTRALRPPVKLRIMRSAPNEENLFLLPDRFSKERTLLKERSSRLT